MEVEDANLVEETLKNDLFIKNTLDIKVKEQNGNFIAGNLAPPNTNGKNTADLELETHSMEVDEIMEEPDLSCIEVSEATMQEVSEPEHMELDEDMTEQTEQTKLENTINCALSEDIFLSSDDSLDKAEVTENTTTTTTATTNGIVSLQVEEIAPENFEQFKQCEEEATPSIVELADGDQIAVDEEKSYSENFKIMDVSSKCDNSLAEEINVAENLDKLEAALNEISADNAIVVEADDEEQSTFLDKTSDVLQIEATRAPEPVISKKLESTTETSVINISDDMVVEKCLGAKQDKDESSKKSIEVEMSKEEPKSADKDLVFDDDVTIVESNEKNIIVEIDDDSNDKVEDQIDVVVEKKECNQQQQPQEEEVADNTEKDKIGTSIIEIDDDDSMPKNQSDQANSTDATETLLLTEPPVLNNIEKPVMMEKADIPMEIAEIFDNKGCINHECARQTTEYYRASMFVLNVFNVNKRKKLQFVCGGCWEIAVQRYEEYAALLNAGKCLYDLEQKKNVSDSVEVIDSSDEEDNEVGNEQTIEGKKIN